MTAKALLVVGARPNYMKAASLLEAAPRHGLEVALVHTGQHYDPELFEEQFKDLGLPPPKHRLEAGRGLSALEQVAAILTALPPVLEAESPDVVVVVGDVTSTLAAALVAAKARAVPVPLAHVEAGLRSGDRTMPEELNRVLVDQLADLLFCSEPSGLGHLAREGRGGGVATLLMVGNTMIDTLLRLRPRWERARAVEGLGLVPRGYALLTLHRPSNVDDPARLARLLTGLGRLAVPIVFPVHPRTRARLEGASCPPNLRLVEPLPYLPFADLTARAALVLTDSGGVQEETTALSVPCLTLRDSTERPVTITHGTNRLVPADPDVIARAAEATLACPPVAPYGPPLWDGRAGERIAAALAGYVEGGPALARARALERGAIAL